MVGSALDCGSGRPQAQGSRRAVECAISFLIADVEEMSMRLRNVWVGWAAAVALAASVVACGGSKEASSTSAEPGGGGGPKVDTATAGGVKGSVAVDGTVPKN